MMINPFKPAGTRAPLTPTQIGIHEQDPSVTNLPMETVTLNVAHDPQPKTKDYKCTDTVEADSNGNYVFDPVKEPEKFGPVNILGNLQTGLDTFLSYCDQDKIPSAWFKIGPFQTTQLSIYAFDRQDEPNAFFNPFPFPDNGKIVMPGVHFGVFNDPKTNEKVYAAASGEVVRHEGGAGHATLHRFRPAYMRSSAAEVAAFHESFGDVTAMLEQLHNPKAAQALADATGGDLTKPNFISDCGEQFGKGINDYVEGQGGPPNYTGGNFVRTAINSYKWQDPSTLPERPDPKNPDQMTSEPHDFSRIWTGAIYDVLTKAVANNMAAGQDATTAITNANEGLLKVYGKLISNTAPEGDFTYADMARAMLKADELQGTNLSATIKEVMVNREILTPDTGIMGNDAPLPKGVREVKFGYTGNESALAGTRLASLGGFQFDASLSGKAQHGLVEGLNLKDKNRIAEDLARLDRRGDILYTTPDQGNNVSYFKPGTHEPFSFVVNWDNGKAKLDRVPIFS